MLGPANLGAWQSSAVSDAIQSLPAEPPSEGLEKVVIQAFAETHRGWSVDEALRLRKTRHLQPELLARVTDWKRSIVDTDVDSVRGNASLLPAQAGIYVFHDKTGYLYIGQAKNLRQRLVEHTQHSDRDRLADYLATSGKQHGLHEPASGPIRIELHVFHKDSPGNNLRIRRAYESELIRTRQPRLNLAP